MKSVTSAAVLACTFVQTNAMQLNLTNDVTDTTETLGSKLAELLDVSEYED